MAGSVDKVYSEAMLSIAREDNCAKEMDQELFDLAQISTDNPELAAVLGAPTVTLSEKLLLTEKIFKGRVSDIAYNFLCVLVQKNRFDALPGIARQFRKSYYADYGISEVTVTTVIPLNDKAREKLLAKLKKCTARRSFSSKRLTPLL